VNVGSAPHSHLLTFQMQVDRGSKTALMQADLHVLSPEDDAATLTARVNEAWDAEYKTHVEESSFLRVCVCVYVLCVCMCY
jgi:hypothetical protein